MHMHISNAKIIKFSIVESNKKWTVRILQWFHYAFIFPFCERAKKMFQDCLDLCGRLKQKYFRVV